MTTTTERPVGAGNPKRYLIAGLAVAYVLAWWLFGFRAHTKPVQARPFEPSAAPGPSVWYQDLRAAERPIVHVPVGWHVVDRTPSSQGATALAAPVPVRVSPARAGRIRTRSS